MVWTIFWVIILTIVAVVLAMPSVGVRMAVELDPRLAACIVDRVLGGSAGPSIAVPVAAASELERGVLTYVAARVVADAAAAAWQVLAVVTTRAALAAAIGDAGAVVWPVTVELGGDRGIARAWLPEPALRARPTTALRIPRGLVIPMTLEAGRASLAGSDLVTLRPGDVVVLDDAWRQAGRLRLRVAGGARMIAWVREEPTGLTVSAIEPGPGPRHKEDDVSDETEREALTRAGDAPVELTIEIARFHMPLAELAALRPGEVVRAGVPLDARVVLRAGDSAVAEGELVDVEGEVGIRLLKLADDAL